MAECADFVVVDRGNLEFVEGGTWLSPKFATGGRNTLMVDGKEKANAYVTIVFSVPRGVVDGVILIRVFINGSQLRQEVSGQEDTEVTAVRTFGASNLKNGGGNEIELRARGEKSFTLREVIVHFRQDT